MRSPSTAISAGAFGGAAGRATTTEPTAKPSKTAPTIKACLIVCTPVEWEDARGAGRRGARDATTCGAVIMPSSEECAQWRSGDAMRATSPCCEQSTSAAAICRHVGAPCVCGAAGPRRSAHSAPERKSGLWQRRPARRGTGTAAGARRACAPRRGDRVHGAECPGLALGDRPQSVFRRGEGRSRSSGGHVPERGAEAPGRDSAAGGNHGP